MKKKIFLITLALVFVIGTGSVIARNNVPGPVDQPTSVTANYDDGTDTITVCWNPQGPGSVDATKWSVVLYSTAIFFWNEDCLDYYGCTSCPDELDVELDYSANEDVYDGTGPNTGKKCIDLSGEMVADDVYAYLNEELEDCMNCQSMHCLNGWTMDPAMTKVKGLAPEKQRRQNNLFSIPAEVNNYGDWYDKWVGQN
jgi:hypothetical protein